MARLTIPHRFRDGQQISGAQLDANFAAIKTVIDSQLDQENLRQLVGIPNTRKANPYSLVPITLSVTEISASGSGQVARRGFVEYPPKAQADNGVEMPPDIGAAAVDSHPFRILDIQGGYVGANGLTASDELGLALQVRKAGRLYLESLQDFDIDNEKTLARMGPIEDDIESFRAHVVLSTGPDNGVRTVRGIMVTIWCKMLHVA
jgi:hypothetical protein